MCLSITYKHWGNFLSHCTSLHSSPPSTLAPDAALPMKATFLDVLCEARVFTSSTGVVLRFCLFFLKTFTSVRTCDIHVIHFFSYIWFTVTFSMSHIMTHCLTCYDSHMTRSSLWLVVLDDSYYDLLYRCDSYDSIKR